MCLRTKQKRPKIADKDITCYKVLRKDMTSLYHNDFKWEFGKLHKTEMQSQYSIVSEKIGKAFHSYKSYKDVREGYFNSSHPCMIVECTIPKGAMYYEGQHGAKEGFASNQIIINKVVDVKEVFPDFPWDKYPYKEGQTIRFTANGHHKGTYKIENIQPAKWGELVYLLLDRGSGHTTNRQGKSIYKYTAEIVEQPNKEA